MPNWCFTQIIFHGEREEIEDLHKKIEEWTSKNYDKSDFGHRWLGNVLHGAGLGHRVDSITNRLRCRGDIAYIGEVDTFGGSDEATFVLDTETAWGPMCLMWSEIIKAQNYKSIGFSYKAEEPGCEIYEVYDPYGDFWEKYYIDIYLEGDDLQNEKLREIYDVRYYEDGDDLKAELQAILETDEDDLKTLIHNAESFKFKNEDSYLYIHEYEFVDAPTE